MDYKLNDTFEHVEKTDNTLGVADDDSLRFIRVLLLPCLFPFTRSHGHPLTSV
jgi:hypothetical protein